MVAHWKTIGASQIFINALPTAGGLSPSTPPRLDPFNRSSLFATMT